MEPPPDLTPYLSTTPWNPVFDPRPRTPDLGYMLRYGVVLVVNNMGILVQHPILPPWIWAYPPEQVYMSTDEIRRAQREQHARARCARPRARIMRALWCARDAVPGDSGDGGVGLTPNYPYPGDTAQSPLSTRFSGGGYTEDSPGDTRGSHRDIRRMSIMTPS